MKAHGKIHLRSAGSNYMYVQLTSKYIHNIQVKHAPARFLFSKDKGYFLITVPNHFIYQGLAYDLNSAPRNCDSLQSQIMC